MERVEWLIAATSSLQFLANFLFDPLCHGYGKINSIATAWVAKE